MSEEGGLVIPGPSVGYTDLIDTALMADDRQYNSFPLRPSSAGKCTRALAFETGAFYKKWELPVIVKEANIKRLLSLGNSVEYHSIKNFELVTKANPNLRVKYKQQTLSLFELNNAITGKPMLIEGNLDLAVVDSEAGTCGFGDVKSTKDKFSAAYKTYWDENSTKFSNMKSLIKYTDQCFYAPSLEEFLFELNDGFFEDNFRQMNVYCMADFAKQHNITHGFIYRYNKNDSRHLEIRFQPSESIYNDFKEKCQLALDMAANESFDDICHSSCDFPLGSIKNAFCDCHKYAGEAGDHVLKAYFKSLPKKNWPKDTSRLGKLGDTMEQMFSELMELDKASTTKDGLENRILTILVNKKIFKLKLDNGHVYEVKWLKSPKPHYELRRGKL